jgi:hypothetical protein
VRLVRETGRLVHAKLVRESGTPDKLRSSSGDVWWWRQWRGSSDISVGFIMLAPHCMLHWAATHLWHPVRACLGCTALAP